MMDNQPWSPAPARYWKDLLQATVVETDCSDLPQRIKEAQDAVMDEIEFCYPTASNSERQRSSRVSPSVRNPKTREEIHANATMRRSSGLKVTLLQLPWN